MSSLGEREPAARPFERVLVANRGEVAIRIARAAAKLGIVPLGVWSDADQGSPHLDAMAASCRLGAADARSSYLSVERVIEAALRLRAEAIHPGYGFLAESPELVEATVAAGLVFVGPRAETVRTLADKGRAKDVARRAGVPVIPGIEVSPGAVEPREEAARLGFPLLVKAAAGGGGRGMRRVEEPDALREAITAASAEALAAFGDARLLLERALDGARHVEVQVLADAHGAVLHLGERDCSSQRRHQKVVEEAPAPGLAPALRERLYQAALSVAREVGYLGAGTVEMLVHGEDVYFLEVNTRLQVEHPVTEEVLGVDLVEWQLRVARGERLPFDQRELVPRGHAIEARLYAEDPAHGFAPRPGRAELFRPAAGSGVRWETALRDGVEVPAHYDPMVAKVVAHGADREEARRRLIDALERTVVCGLVTNRDFLVDYLRSPAFASPAAGAPDTATLPAFVEDWREATEEDSRCTALCALALAGYVGAWARGIAPWSSAVPLPAYVPYELDGVERGGIRAEARIQPLASGRPCFAVTLGSGEAVGAAAFPIEVELLLSATLETVGGGELCSLAVRWGVEAHSEREAAVVWVEGSPAGRPPAVAFAQRCGRSVLARRRARAAAAEDDPGVLLAPMAGQVTQVLAVAGESVSAGQSLFVLEAMKLEARVRAPFDGVLVEIAVRSGEHVPHRRRLGWIEASRGTSSE
ncbi:MAG TPA: biotin carboxylase N-terminal domain-containing protein [Thermoanaerobaculia bacterium]|nr:biotin carboxylase N-terminal domain-containing protein [Thermoanaerobaculia bacterium]